MIKTKDFFIGCSLILFVVLVLLTSIETLEQNNLRLNVTNTIIK